MIKNFAQILDDLYKNENISQRIKNKNLLRKLDIAEKQYYFLFMFYFPEIIKDNDERLNALLKQNRSILNETGINRRR